MFTKNVLKIKRLENAHFYLKVREIEIEILGKHNEIFPSGPVIKFLMY